ncbi:MAG: hypothetical protein IJ189_06545 [Clostridia bacterium]|nr:hypothetical protein [Clostridia bacterium]
MERIEELYGQLYQDMKPYFKKYSLSTLVPMEGSQYKNQTIKLMLIGRALNGWFMQDMDCADTCSQYAKDAMDMLKNKGRFVWMQNKEENNNAIIRPFWNYTKDILKRLRNCDEIETDWYETIVWANLFPISFANKGNPSNEIKYAQFQAAKNLLNAQIEYFKPTHILIISGWKDWFVLQRRKNCLEQDTPFLPNVYERNVNKEVVKGSGTYEITGSSTSEIIHIPVVISRRPEFFNKEIFVNDVVLAFQHPEGAK